MSSNEQEQFLNDILGEIERHRDIYRFVDFKSVIARKKDLSSRDAKWYNFVTLITMLYSNNLKPWEKHIAKDNFAILSAVITIDHFRQILESLINNNVIEVDEYQVYGTFNLSQRSFLDSGQAKRLYDIDWAINLWRATGKENFGLPDSRSLELELDDVPFRDPIDAVRYYTGLSLRSDSSLQNAIHIVAPLYYARIKKVELSGRELFVEIDSNLATTQDLRIKYNTEGPDERSQYYKTLEADTVQLVEGTTRISLKQDMETATVWLYHVKGYTIDSRTERRMPSIGTLERDLSQENPYLWEEGIRVITETINLRSKDVSALITTEQMVDSIDVEILKAVKTLGGDYAKCIPEVLKYLSLDMLLSRLARLKTLGFLTIEPPKKILLTSPGVDALNLPPSVLPAKVPPEIGKRMAEIQLALKDEDYDEVTNKSTRLLETLLRESLEVKFKGTFQDVWPNLNLGTYDRASLGTLKDASIRLKVFKENSVADHLISTILQLRVPMSHEKGKVESPSHIALLSVRLVEAFLRNWYYL